jgi:3-oxoacyl-[acyl-carrier protein] reductase
MVSTSSVSAAWEGRTLVTEKRIALVTGGTGGLGLAIGTALAQNKLKVVLGDLNEAKAKASAAALPGSGHIGVRLDVADETSVVEAFAAAAQAIGQVSVLVCSAGIQRKRDSAGFGAPGRRISPLPTASTELADWNRTIAVNATGTFLAVRELIRQLPEDCRNGRIVTFSSVAARYGSIMSGIDYVATKGAIIAITKTLAAELALQGVTANCIAPGLIETPMFRASVKPEDDAEVSKQVPLGYIGKPEDIAATVSFLVSDAANYITGVTVDVNGGLHMQ